LGSFGNVQTLGRFFLRPLEFLSQESNLLVQWQASQVPGAMTGLSPARTVGAVVWFCRHSEKSFISQSGYLVNTRRIPGQFLVNALL
jgi:hypothetical protein